MKFSKREAKAVGKALDHWQAAGLIGGELAASLAQSAQPAAFDWRRLARYSFWVAVICVFTAVSTLLADDAFIALFERLFTAPEAAKCVGLAILAAVFYALGIHRRRRKPGFVFSAEALLFLGVLSTAGAIVALGLAIGSDSDDGTPLLLLACLIYAALGLVFRSTLIWIFALLSLGGWFGAKTGYVSGWGAYYLGMSYPLRFVAFGAALIAAGEAMRRMRQVASLALSTVAIGMLYVFLSLWILSIFGNYGDLMLWRKSSQAELAVWSVLFAAAAGLAILHGLKFDDAVTKGIGLTFLFINLYTRFFEHFWDSLHKAVFFAVLGASLWLLGMWAERIWRLGEVKPDEGR